MPRPKNTHASYLKATGYNISCRLSCYNHLTWPGTQAWKLCLCLKFSEPEVGFVVNSLSTQDIPILSVWGTAGEASTIRCLGRVLPPEGKCVSPMNLPLPPSPDMEAMARPGDMEGVRREGETEHLILSVLCLILSALLASLLMSACFHYLNLLPHEK